MPSSTSRALVVSCSCVLALGSGALGLNASGCSGSSSSSSATDAASSDDATFDSAGSQAGDAPADTPVVDAPADNQVTDAAGDTRSVDAPSDSQAGDAAGDHQVADAGPDASDASNDVTGLPVTPLVTGTYSAGAAWGPTVSGGPPNYQGGVWGSQTVTFDTAGEMLQISNASWTLSTSSPLPEFGADGIVGWGRWSTGTSTSGGPSTIEAFSYIVGVQTPSASSLQATYTAFASTAPTAWATSTTVGTPNQVTGTVTYASGTGTVTFSLSNITVGGQSFSITGSTGLYATTGFLADGTVTPGGGGCDAGCGGNITNAPMVQGWFYGASGERAALNYGFTTSLGTVSGAVVLR